MTLFPVFQRNITIVGNARIDGKMGRLFEKKMGRAVGRMKWAKRGKPSRNRPIPVLRSDASVYYLP